MNKKLLGRIATGVSIVFYSSCNPMNDRASYVNSTLLKQVDSASNHLLELSDFTKVNGVERQDGSLKYELKFEARISAKKDCYWDGNISYSPLDQSRIAVGMVTLGTDSLNPNFIKRNYGYNIKGTAVFEKTDNGWTLISIYFI
jgi:hypothetical protein